MDREPSYRRWIAMICTLAVLGLFGITAIASLLITATVKGVLS